MARYAIIEDGVVANIAVHTTARSGWVNITGQDVHIGDLYDGSTFTRPDPIIAVPTSVSMRQARLALLGAGLLDDAETALNALPSPAKEAALIEWEYASAVERDSPLITSMAGALNLDDAALDALFIAASAL